MSKSDRVNIEKQRKNKNLKIWCEWRMNVFGFIRYKQLIKQMEYYEEN